MTRARGCVISGSRPDIKAMWTEDEGHLRRQVYTGATPPSSQPKGVQSPHIPMLIAGAGEKVTLKLVALYGDGCNVIESRTACGTSTPILEEHCKAAKRDYASVLKTTCSYCVITDTDARPRP